MKPIVFYIFAGFFLATIFSCGKESFTRVGMANDHFFLQNEGQNMPVRVAGNLSSDKLLVIIHGGPGGSALEFRSAYVVQNVESKFAVVYWDQRYAGGSQGNGGTSSIDQFRKDLKKLLFLLKEKYGSDKKLYLMGHSWGGFLAPYFLIEDNNQQMIAGLIQADGAFNPRTNQVMKEAFLNYGAAEISAGRNEKFWKEIIDFCNSPEYKENDYNVMIRLNKWAHEAEDKLKHLKPNEPENKMAPDNHIPLISHALAMFNSSRQGIYKEAYETNPVAGNINKISLPVLLLWGKHDLVCPVKMMDVFMQGISSTDVQTHIFNGSFHRPMENEPVEYWNTLTEWMEQH